MSASCAGGISAAGAPGASDSGRPQTVVIRKGATETITATRVAWTSESVRTFPPASSPKISMSCRPPGIAA